MTELTEQPRNMTIRSNTEGMEIECLQHNY